MRNPSDGLSRRRFLQLSGGGLALVAVGATAACGSDGSGPSSSPKSNKLTNVPAHNDPVKVEGAIIPDVAGVPIGYTTLPAPADLVTTVPEPPGSGEELTHFHITWSVPETPLAKNKYWQGLNERLNVDFKMTSVPASDYDAKFATMIASGDIPDVVQVLNTATCMNAAKEGAFADLTDDLGGDKMEEYPNLSNVRPDQWKASAINGRIYGIPIDIPAVQPQFRLRVDWAEKLGVSTDPKTAAELADTLAAISKGKPEGNKQVWGVTAFSPAMTLSSGSAITQVANAMFHVPNQWKAEGDKLIHQIETDEYEAALKWLNDLWKAGGFHPDALALGTQGAKDLSLLSSGQVGMTFVSAQNWYMPSDYKDAVAASGGGLAPWIPQGHDGKPATFVKSSGSYGVNALSAEAAKDPERRKEMLRVFNYLRAPVGSVEWYYCKYGADGDYYEARTGPGEPTPIEGRDLNTDKGVLYYGCAPQAWVFPEVQECIDINSEMVRSAVANPTQGLTSETQDQRFAQLDQLTQTFVNAMVTGQRPLSDLEEFRKQWSQRGGDQIRSEFQKAMSESA